MEKVNVVVNNTLIGITNYNGRAGLERNCSSVLCRDSHASMDSALFQLFSGTRWAPRPQAGPWALSWESSLLGGKQR